MEIQNMVWSFERSGERRQLEIRRAETDGYDIVVRQSNGEELAEWCPEAADLISRQTALATSWQACGWRPHHTERNDPRNR
jgi:hypothetical protein